MTVEAMTWAFKQPLPPRLKLVLLALADQANDKWECFPGQELLAAKCSMGERTVRRHLAELEAIGTIKRTPRMKFIGRGRTSDHYKLNPPKDDAANQASPARPTGHIGREDDAANQASPARPTGHIGREDEPTNRPVRVGPTGQFASDQPATVGRGTQREPKENPKTRARRSDFDAFWDRYPRKAARRKADAAYSRALTRATAGEIAAGLDAHLPGWSSSEPRFIPHPATWLDEDRWLDTPDHQADDDLLDRYFGEDIA